MDNDKKDVTVIADKLINISQYLQSIQNIFIPIIPHIVLFEKQFAQLVQKILPNFELIYDSVKHIPSKLEHVSKMLATQGWFINSEFDLDDIKIINELLDNDELEKLDSMMSNYIEKELDEIRKIVFERSFKRKEILNSAFKAHIDGEYNLSIPVFLAQTDGMCYDLLGNMLFSTRKPKKKEDPEQKKIPKTADAISKFVKSNSITKALVSPLTIITAFNLSDNEKQSDVINRHKILHGKDLDYGTKLNSLKCISLLYFVNDSVYKAIEMYVELLCKMDEKVALEIEPELDKLRELFDLRIEDTNINER